MLQSRIFFILLTTSTALTIFTASMASSSMELSLMSYLPTLCRRDAHTAHSNATMELEDGGSDTNSQIDYSDVDYLSYELEHQIIQLLGDEKDSVHKMEDIYPGRTGHHGSSYNKNTQPERKNVAPYLRYKHTVLMPFMRKRIPGWQLEIFYNAVFEPFWPKMRVLLKNWADNRRFEPQVMHHLVQYVKRPIDESYARLNRQAEGIHVGKRYRTCAVVGNSGILLNSLYGGAIDQHEMVMRINNARTVGFESFVGRKTTISFVISHILRACAKRNLCWCHPYGA